MNDGADGEKGAKNIKSPKDLFRFLELLHKEKGEIIDAELYTKFKNEYEET